MFRCWMRGSAMALTTGGDGGDGDQRPDLDVPPHSLPSVVPDPMYCRRCNGMSETEAKGQSDAWAESSRRRPADMRESAVALPAETADNLFVEQSTISDAIAATDATEVRAGCYGSGHHSPRIPASPSAAAAAATFPTAPSTTVRARPGWLSALSVP